MNALALLQLQQGLYGKLAADGVLMGMLNGLYDQVPERAQLPYAVIGDGQMQPVATDTATGARCVMRIRVYSQKPGRKEVLRILDRIYGQLHHGTVTLVESDVITMQVRSAETRLLSDARTIEAVLEVECLISEVAL